MATGKVVLVIGFKQGDNEVLKASLAAWAKNFTKCELVVIGDKCELPKDVTYIEFDGNANQMVKAAAEKLEAESFIFTYGAYPLKKVTLTDIDAPYCNPEGDFYTRLPRVYHKAQVLATTPQERVAFEHTYFAEKYKKLVPIVLRDLSDSIRLQVFDLNPNAYIVGHLLKHNKFLVTNKHGQKAVNFLS